MGAMNKNLHQRTLRRPPLPASMRLEFDGGEGMPLRAAVHGEIDYSGAFSMQVRIAAACRRRRSRGLIVDLTGTEFMSSSGLAALLNLQRESACLRGGMLLASPTPEVRHLLEVTGVDQRLRVVDSLRGGEDAAAVQRRRRRREPQHPPRPQLQLSCRWGRRCDSN